MSMNGVVPPLIDDALTYAGAGMHVFPLHGINEDGTCSCLKADCSSPGKHPLTQNGFKSATADPATVRAWWERRPLANIGMVTGEVSGYVVIDIDPDHGGNEGLSALETKHGALPITRMVRTGGGGNHFFFKYPSGVNVPCSAGKLAPGVDVRANGGYVVMSPSMHRSGRRYEFINFVQAAEIPTPWLALLTKSKQAAPASNDAGVIKKGERNETLFKVASSLRGRGLGEDVIVPALVSVNEHASETPLDADELETIIASVVDRYSAGAEREHFTDVGNALRLVRLYGCDLRYCAKIGGWLHYDGRRWVLDETGEVERRAKATVRSMYAEAAAIEDADLRKTLLDHARKSEAAPRIAAMIQLARSEPGIAVSPDELDTGKFLLNLPNGTYDLATNELRPHRREDLITKLAGAAYSQDATAPLWEKFLARVVPDDVARAYLQRYVGYSLCGDTGEHCFCLCYGVGRNGKGTFIKAVSRLSGDHHERASFETFLLVRDRGARNDIARLRGARLVTAEEMQDGRAFDEGVIKTLTGGDEITCRFLFHENFTYTPNFKLLFAVNHRPGIKGTDLAIWSRVHLLRWEVVIPEEERDQRLSEKLAGELSGILNWALEGHRAWRETGLDAPPSVRAATDEYRQDSDVLGGFLEECFVAEESAHVSAAAVRELYKRWCERTGEKALSENKVGAVLKERGYVRGKERGDGNRFHWYGLRAGGNDDSEP